MSKLTTGERLMALEVKLDTVIDKVDEVNKNLSRHITTSDDKYASKERLKNVEARLESHVQKQGDDDSYWKKNAFNIGSIVFMALIALLTYIN